MPESRSRAPVAGGAPAEFVLRQLDRTQAMRVKLRVLIVAAHPDDEVVGLGARLGRASSTHVAHVTDGSPRRLEDARAAGLATREAYAALRKLERGAALAFAGVPESRVHDLDRVDQESAFDLPSLALDLAELVRRVEPDVVVTHPYEGGHPDHDATAFAVHAAVRLLGGASAVPPVVEMASYHMGERGIRTGCFLERGGAAGTAASLADEGRERRARLFAMYASQQRVLAQFDCGREPLRVAPRYAFGVPPHEGRLFYEHFDWGLDAQRWCELARHAAWRLGVPELVA